MLTRDLIVDAWELAGEPQDLDPYQLNAPSVDTAYLDPASAGVAHYLRVISNAQVMLSNWKTSRGRPIRFKRFYNQRNVKLGRTDSLNCFVDLADLTTLRLDAVPSWVNPDYMDTCRIDVEWSGIVDDGSGAEPATASFESACMFADWTDTTQTNVYAYLMEDMDIPENAISTTSCTATLSFDRYSIVAGTGMGDYVTVTLPTTFKNLLRVSTSSDGSALSQVAYREDLMNPQLTDGTPSEWYTVGDRIFFDVYVTEPQWFTIEYQRTPTILTDLDQEIDIPESWHSVVLMLVLWIEAQRLQDVEKALALKSQLNASINLLRPETEEEFLRESTRGFQVVRETR